MFGYDWQAPDQVCAYLCQREMRQSVICTYQLQGMLLVRVTSSQVSTLNLLVFVVQNCKQQFCPQHRFPADHNCASTTATASASTAKVPSQQISELSNKASAASMATIDAVRKKWAATPISASSKPVAVGASSRPSNSLSNATSSNNANPFSKTDR